MLSHCKTFYCNIGAKEALKSGWTLVFQTPGRALRSGRRGRKKPLFYRNNNRKQNTEMWLSLVERCVRDAEAAGSSPVISTKKKRLLLQSFFLGRSDVCLTASDVTCGSDVACACDVCCARVYPQTSHHCAWNEQHLCNKVATSLGALRRHHFTLSLSIICFIIYVIIYLIIYFIIV